MKTMFTITKVIDKKLALKWLYEIGYTFLAGSDLLKTIPFTYKVNDRDLSNWAPYCSIENLESLKDLRANGHGDAPPLEKCGLEIEKTIVITSQEAEMLDQVISRIETLQSAHEWYSSQPEDVRSKIDLLIGSSGARG